jgi:general secretion pathway protein N
MNKSVYIAALAYYVLLLLITAPASLLDAPIRQLSHGSLSLANCQGTIWHGSATPVLHLDKNAIYPLHTLNWTIMPKAWFVGQFRLIANFDDQEKPMELTLDRKGAVLENPALTLSAQALGDLSPFLKPAGLGGNLRIESHQLSYTNGQFQGRAVASWNEASSFMSTTNPLGDYRIDIVAANNEIHATLSTQSGALLLSGEGSWSGTTRFKFNGTARAAAQSNLNELLHHLGPEVEPGTYRITL